MLGSGTPLAGASHAKGHPWQVIALLACPILPCSLVVLEFPLGPGHPTLGGSLVRTLVVQWVALPTPSRYGSQGELLLLLLPPPPP